MKKLYFMMVALFVAMTANAQLYLVGDWNGQENWTLPGLKVDGNNGVYNFTLNNCSKFKMSTKYASEWDGEDGYNAGCLGTDQDLHVGSNDIFQYGEDQVLPWTGDWTVKVDLNNNTMTLSTTTPQPQGFPEVWMRGTVGGTNWACVDQYKMSTNDGVTYTLATSIAVGEEFKFADSSWSKINLGGVPNMEPNVEYVLIPNQMSNCSVATNFTGVVILNVNLKTVTLSTNMSGVEAIATENGAAQYYNLQGVRVANPERGLFIKVQDGKASKVVL